MIRHYSCVSTLQSSSFVAYSVNCEHWSNFSRLHYRCIFWDLRSKTDRSDMQLSAQAGMGENISDDFLLWYFSRKTANVDKLRFGCDSLYQTSLTLGSVRFYPRDAMLARVFATATCPSVRLSVRQLHLSHAGIVPSRAKAGSWNVHHLIAPWL